MSAPPFATGPVSAEAAAAAARDRATAQRTLVFLILLPFAAITTFGIALVAGIEGIALGIAAVAISTSVITTLPLILQFARPAADRHLLLSVLTLVFNIYFVVPILTQWFLVPERGISRGDGGFQTFTLTPDTVLGGQLAVLLGIVSLLLGYFTPIAPFFAKLLPKQRRDWTESSSIILAMIMIPAGWTVFLAGQLGILPRSAGSGFLGAISKTH